LQLPQQESDKKVKIDEEAKKDEDQDRDAREVKDETKVDQRACRYVSVFVHWI